MPRYLSYLFGAAIASTLVGVPVGYGLYYQAQIRNFHAVSPGVLYRSGQMSLIGLQRVIRDCNIKTVVTLRDTPYPDRFLPPDWEEEKYCIDQEINYLRISPRTWGEAPDGSVPAEEGLLRFLKLMDDPNNYPVLVHCFGGVHRTGALCAIYRMEYEHWTNEEAIIELRACGYSTLDDDWDILEYLETYRPRWRGPPPQVEGATSNKLFLRTSLRPKRHPKKHPEVHPGADQRW